MWSGLRKSEAEKRIGRRDMLWVGSKDGWLRIRLDTEKSGNAGEIRVTTISEATRINCDDKPAGEKKR